MQTKQDRLKCLIFSLKCFVLYTFNATTHFLGFNEKIFQKQKPLDHKNECDSESTPNGLQTVFYFFLLSDYTQPFLLSLFFLQAMSWPGKTSKLLKFQMK